MTIKERKSNAHRTKEAAEAYRAWLTDPRTQARRMVEACDGFDVAGRGVIYLSTLYDVIASRFEDNIPNGGLRFTKRIQAQAAIDKLGEDLIKVALDVITGDDAREIVMRAMRKV